MSILNEMFREGQTENALYSKLKYSLLKSSFEHKILKAYFLFGLPYSDENLQILKSRIFSNINFKDLVEPNRYHVTKDNVELYLVGTDDGNSYFVLLLDPYELYSEVRILEVILAPEIKLDFEPELIFSCIKEE